MNPTAPGPGTRVTLSLAAVLLLGPPTPAAAQIETTVAPDGGVKWGIIDAIGYGGLGFGLGVLATWDRQQSSGPSVPSSFAIPGTDPSGTAFAYGFSLDGISVLPDGATLLIVGATTAAGTVAGAVIGGRAQNAVAEGQPVRGTHRAAVMGGGVMAGGAVGALAAAALIIPGEEGTFLGSDEQTVSLLVLAGSTLGALYVWRRRDELSSSQVRVVPEVSERGEYGLRVRVAL